MPSLPPPNGNSNEQIAKNHWTSALLLDPSTTTWWAQCTMPVEVRRHLYSKYCAMRCNALRCTAPLFPFPTDSTPHMALGSPRCGLTETDGLTRDIGDDGLAEYKSRIGRTGAAAKNKSSSPWAAKLKDRFRIYFPTDETVAQSRGGRMVSLVSARLVCRSGKTGESSHANK